MSEEDAIAKAKERRVARERGESVDDFIYRGNARGGKITAINKKDELLGMKAGGTIQKALKDLAEGAGNRSMALLEKAGNKGQPAVINLYVGQKKIDTIVIDALDSAAGRKRFLPTREP